MSCFHNSFLKLRITTKNKTSEEKKVLNNILGPINKILTYRNSLLDFEKELLKGIEERDGEKGNAASEKGAEEPFS